MMPNRHTSRKSSRFQRWLKPFMKGVLRSLWWFSGQRRRTSARAGFVFPTTLLLILMVLLTASALTFRTFSRSSQVISQREQQVIYNAATPAIDRAKAKLEFLFSRQDNRLIGVPSSDYLANMMLPEDDRIPDPASQDIELLNGLEDPYSLPDETRLDINGDGNLDNAWAFLTDVDGDGEIEADEWAAYSILVDHEAVNPETGDVIEIFDRADANKAGALVTRTGPLATTQAVGACGGAAVIEDGWQEVGNQIEKNFQVTAFVSNNRGNRAGQTFESLEFQQSRIASSANKWGAWFRYDLDIFPGEDFKWNGAMHTDGSLIVENRIESYMLTSHFSCLYSEEASEITLGQVPDDGSTFQGQAIKGRMKENDYGGRNVGFHLFDGDGRRPRIGQALTNNNDSVDQGGGGLPADVAMNPITLFLEDRSEHMNRDSWERDEDWEDSALAARIRNAPEDRPFVDDFFRADDRWGPKPRYDIDNDDLSLENDPNEDNDNREVGEPIDKDDASLELLHDEETGFDGYWERQAIRSGLRLIVGQRLELGNANGWGYDPSAATVAGRSAGDPLYPPLEDKATLSGGFNADEVGNHEYRQHRTLQDNLAAVQGMVVYHYEGPGDMATNGEFPAACMAVTSHPGTPQSIVNSRSFDTFTNGEVVTDFLTGNGTNGWEFSYPTNATDGFSTAADFESRYNNTNSALRRALTNLARFAGDPFGGAPSFPPVQNELVDGFIHPFPYFSMWGDFSALRRIVVDDYAATNYEDLSYADQATLHSAACTLSMLAYNLDALETEFDAIPNTAWGNDTNADGVSDSGMARTLLGLVNAGVDLADVGTTPPDEWIRLAAAAPGADEDEIALMRLAAEYLQVERDRTFGFATGRGLEDIAVTAPSTSVGVYDPTAGVFTLPDPAPAAYTVFAAGNYSVSCDPDNFVENNDITDPEEALTLALALCPKVANTAPANPEKSIKYPSLYYLFPIGDHGQKDNSLTTSVAQYETEEYIDATAAPEVAGINDDITTYTVNGDAIDIYRALEPSDIAGEPRAADFSDWVLPTTPGTVFNENDVVSDNTAVISNVAFAINVSTALGTAARNVPFLDKGLFNGREQMAVRVLDIDIDALVDPNVRAVADYWLPSRADDPNDGDDFATRGVVYAIREDAVREDEIVRPANAAATDCAGLNGTNFRVVAELNCRMSVIPGAEQDPPLQANNVSIKPVDFAPDPDRRPHGFRFRASSGNPVDFSGGDPENGRQNGMTFVSDSTAYLQGDFNLHTTNGQRDSFVEEFTDTLQNRANFGPNDFYDNRTANEINTDTFADLSEDHWRPVEILTDGLTVLSAGFPDGAIEDAFQAGNVQDSSFGALNRPVNNGPWLRQEPDNDDTPIWIDRNGTYYIRTAAGTGNAYFNVLTNDNNFISMGEDNLREASLHRAERTFVNATFVGGIVPERPNESYGGLHNYPRFLEYWRDQDLFISGSFIQLNFSTSATAPYDQEAWEPGAVPTANEWIEYYSPPRRRWGFDVGLLYNPPAPAAERFNQVGRSRSEYYRELPADDPYISNLRCARYAATEGGDPDTDLFPDFCNQN